MTPQQLAWEVNAAALWFVAGGIAVACRFLRNRDREHWDSDPWLRATFPIALGSAIAASYFAVTSGAR